LAWFQRHGEYVIFFARMVPIVRSLISVPAGLASMHIGRFTLYTALGTGLWSFVLAFAGRMLGAQWELVAEFIDQYQTLVLITAVVAVVGFFAVRLWKRRPHQHMQHNEH
jgi:membrane protein DedA with SNARE-associated domain